MSHGAVDVPDKTICSKTSRVLLMDSTNHESGIIDRFYQSLLGYYRWVLLITSGALLMGFTNHEWEITYGFY